MLFVIIIVAEKKKISASIKNMNILQKKKNLNSKIFGTMVNVSSWLQTLITVPVRNVRYS